MYAKINWLRAGILSADKILTVSPNYAREISANPQGGAELDDVIRCGPGWQPVLYCMILGRPCMHPGVYTLLQDAEVPHPAHVPL